MTKNEINIPKIITIKKGCPVVEELKDKTIYNHDNIEVLEAILPDTVDLIATDPPFNANQNFHANPGSDASGSNFCDKWLWSKENDDWLEKLSAVDAPKKFRELRMNIESIKVSGGPSMAAYIAFMSVRLYHMERVLKKDGSIYLHCDQTSSHYLKTVMDTIFGRRKFNSEITWKRHSAHNTKVFGNVCDKILFYGPSPSRENKDDVRIPLTEEYIKSFFVHDDERGMYGVNSLTGPRINPPDGRESLKPWKGVTTGNMPWSPPGTGAGNYGEWINDNIVPGYLKMDGVHKRLDALDDAGLIYWPKDGKGFPRLKKYFEADKGMLPQNLVNHINRVNNGYPTQKPVELYELFIKASSKEGDMVLDPFCGGGTSLVAAENLGRKWVGIDNWEHTPDYTVDRMNGELGGLFSSELELIEGAPNTEKTEDSIPVPKSSPINLVKPLLPQVMAIMMDRLKVGEKYGCPGCGDLKRKGDFQKDHEVPQSILKKSKRLANLATNLTPLCGPCNLKKSDNFQMPGLWKILIKEKKMVSIDRAKEFYNWIDDIRESLVD